MDVVKNLKEDYFILVKKILEISVGERRPELKDIDDALDKLCSLAELSKESIESLRKRLTANMIVEMGSGTFITDDSHQLWFNEYKAHNNLYYWERYRLLLDEKGFPKKVIRKMDDVSDTIVDLLGSPRSEKSYHRKGLVIGDVQSGKTANYISVITKAADAGYKAIILLTGTLNSLRSQTQERIDEGFIGVDSSQFLENKENFVGVGKIDRERKPLSVTTLDEDFSISLARKLQVQLKDYTEPAVFVVKKNASVLKNLIRWFDNANTNKHKKDIPLLIIDDEADYASVNTKKEDENPTTINSRIREIIKLFPKVTYVGFTATPFANIFINPNSEGELVSDDLFPRNFIYVLDSPTNYIGPNIFFGDENEKLVRVIDDIEECIPFNHKKDFDIDCIPESLEEALLSFFIINTLRDLRGDISSHRTMLVNVSRFTNVQNKLAEFINAIIYDWKRIFKHFSIAESKGVARKLYDSLGKIYEKEFYYIGDYNKFDLYEQVRSSSQLITVTAVNMSNKADKVINYKQNSANGLRVIAVGGLTLSRGLTLEGLSVSYFYRNSRYYDTLMQMGRWFGYRPNYEDLCKLYMSEEANSWYSYINDATEELKEEIRLMRSQHKTPIEFGLKVMSHPDTLLITAPNKLRTAANYVKSVSLSGMVIETPRLYNSCKINEDNLSAFESLATEIEGNYETEEIFGSSVVYKNVEKDKVIQFLGDFKAHRSNLHFQTRELTQYINDNKDELDQWDILVVGGSSKNIKEYGSIKVKPSYRKYIIKDDGIIQLSGNKNRLGSTTDTKAGLTANQIIKAEESYKKNNTGNKGKNAKIYLRYVDDRNPLMIIYIVELRDEDSKEENKVKIKERITIGLGLGFPKLGDYKKENFIQYKLNKVYYDQLFLDLDFGEDEDDN